MRYLKFIFLFILLYFAGCLFVKEKLVGEYYLSDEERAAVPFHGFETAAFIHGIDDPISLTAGPRENQLIKSYIDREQTEYVVYEEDNITFTNDTFSLRYFLSNGGPGKSFAIVLKYKVGTDDVSLQAFYNLPLSRENLSDKDIFSDSLLVNNKWYYEVFIDSMYNFAQCPAPGIGIYATWCYYSPSDGMIKLDFSDGSTWELKEIVW
jgi:hypothetical protein